MIAWFGRSVYPLAAIAMAFATSAHGQSLRLGDTAPPLRVSRWLKNGPIANLEPGKVYVIELCATWSPTLRDSIPFLDYLQARHRDNGVTVAAVSVREASRTAAEQFLTKTHSPPLAPVEYAFGADDVPTPPQGAADNRVWAVENGHMSTAWMKATGRSTVPSTYIVDRQGRLAWMGNTLYPRGELEAALERVLGGAFTPDDARALSEQFKAREQREKDAEERYRRAFSDHKPAEAVAAIDDLLAIDAAHWLPLVAAKKFQLLMMEVGDARGAAAFAAASLEGGLKDAVQPLNDMAWIMLTAPPALERDLDLALRLAARADELVGHRRADVIDTLARAHFEKGDVDRAIALQSEAIDLQRKAVEAAPNKEGPTRLLQDLETTLKHYQEAKAKRR